MDGDYFVNAWSKTTGEFHSIPKDWVDHPVLGEDFTTEEPEPDRKIQATITPKPTATVTATPPKN